MDQKAKYIILESLDNMLEQQYASHTMNYDILFILQEIFDDKGKSTRKVALKTIMNIRMIEGTLIKNHIVYMIRLFNEIKILVVTIDRKTKVNLILESLSNSFAKFKFNYSIYE